MGRAVPRSWKTSKGGRLFPIFSNAQFPKNFQRLEE